MLDHLEDERNFHMICYLAVQYPVDETRVVVAALRNLGETFKLGQDAQEDPKSCATNFAKIAIFV